MAFSSTTGEVMDALRVTRNTLTRFRAADILRPGIHYTAAGVGLQKPNLRWDLDAMQETIARRGKGIARPRAEAART